MSRNIAVIGLGRFGRSVAVNLAASGVEVLAIDQELSLIDAIAAKVSQAVSIDATDRDSLQAHDVPSVEAAVVAIGENFEAAVLITSLLHEFGIPMIIARAYDSTQRRILELVGATEVINPEEEFGERVARGLVQDDVVDFIDLPEGFVLREVRVPPRFFGQPLSALLADCAEKVLAVRLTRPAEAPSTEGAEAGAPERIAVPSEELELKEGDLVALVGPVRVLERI